MIKSVLLLVALAVIAVRAQNDRPIIGILTQPVTGGDLFKYGNAYIAASYVKYVESGGARVVPIFHNASPDELMTLLKSINGILFPGGGAVFQGVYLQTLQTLWQAIQTFNAQGDFVPAWGTCMGFQELAMLASGNWSLLYQFDSWNISLPLEFTAAAPSSRLFSGMSTQMYQNLIHKDLTLNNHHWGVRPEDWGQVSKYFKMLSTNVDRAGRTFVSTYEGVDLPVYATQWHPEKNLFEWYPTAAIDHGLDAILVSQYTLTYFVNQTRQSNHRFPSRDAESKALIYNYNPLFTGVFDSDFVQCYVWKL